MALVKCPDCGKDTSDLASACVGCGRPMKPSNTFNIKQFALRLFSHTQGKARIDKKTFTKEFWRLLFLWLVVVLPLDYFTGRKYSSLEYPESIRTTLIGVMILWGIFFMVAHLNNINKRFHDLGYSSLAIIVLFFPIPFLPLIYLMIKDGSPTVNKFGPPPLSSFTTPQDVWSVGNKP